MKHFDDNLIWIIFNENNTTNNNKKSLHSFVSVQFSINYFYNIYIFLFIGIRIVMWHDMDI